MKLPNKPRVLAATYNPVSNTKMISFLVDFPTVLLAELRTHRVIDDTDNEPLYAYNAKVLNDFNLSANSARAIPAKTYLNKILENPFVPVWTGKQAGMSGSVVTEQQKEEATHLWLEHLQSDIVDTGTAQYVEDLIELGIHKQNANRLLSPFAYTTCIISGTEWDNFFELRCPKYEYQGYFANSKKELYNNMIKNNPDAEPHFIYDSIDENKIINKSSAQPEFQVIAEMLYDLYQEADWKESKYHIPFEEDIIKTYKLIKPILELDIKNVEEREHKQYELIMKISASMCAKLSYNTQDNEDTLEKHLERAEMLIEHKHQEPFSHQAVAMGKDEYESFAKLEPYSEKNKDKYDSIREWFDSETPVIKQGMYFGKCYNLTGFKSFRYILENY